MSRYHQHRGVPVHVDDEATPVQVPRPRSIRPDDETPAHGMTIVASGEVVDALAEGVVRRIREAYKTPRWTWRRTALLVVAALVLLWVLSVELRLRGVI